MPASYTGTFTRALTGHLQWGDDPIWSRIDFTATPRDDGGFILRGKTPHGFIEGEMSPPENGARTFRIGSKCAGQWIGWHDGTATWNGRDYDLAVTDTEIVQGLDDAALFPGRVAA